MKKLVIKILFLTLSLFNLTPCFALNISKDIEPIADNLTIEYTLEEINSTRATYQKVGKKTANVKNGNTILWSVTVTGTFEYDGTHSICTNSVVSTTCSADNWVLSNKKSSKSGSTAKASADGTKYTNGLITDTKTVSVALVCGSDGTLY